MPKGGDVGEAFGGDPAGGSGAVDGLGAAGAGETLVERGPVAGFAGGGGGGGGRGGAAGGGGGGGGGGAGGRPIAGGGGLRGLLEHVCLPSDVCGGRGAQ